MEKTRETRQNMAKLNDRENAFENKFAHDEKLNFKIDARCAKLFGLWAAEKQGLSGDAALSYAGDIISANIEKPGFQHIMPKIKADLAAKGVEITDHSLQSELERIREDAKDQILDESGS
jgi:hypothetical protein